MTTREKVKSFRKERFERKKTRKMIEGWQKTRSPSLAVSQTGKRTFKSSSLLSAIMAAVKR